MGTNDMRHLEKKCGGGLIPMYTPRVGLFLGPSPCAYTTSDIHVEANGLIL